MALLTINSYNEFEEFLGKELGVSDYLQVTQEMINKFAEASLDFQWIHIDTERAQKESPYKSTIAHGYFNISILPYLWDQIVEVKNLKMSVNYGIERLRFMEPVLVNSRIRIRAKLVDLVNLRGITKANLHVKLEIEGSKKPALEGVIIFLYHFINS